MAAGWQWALGKGQEVQKVASISTLQFNSLLPHFSKCVPQAALTPASQIILRYSHDRVPPGKSLAPGLVWLLSLILGLVLIVQVITEPWKLQNYSPGICVVTGLILTLYFIRDPCPP